MPVVERQTFADLVVKSVVVVVCRRGMSVVDQPDIVQAAMRVDRVGLVLLVVAVIIPLAVWLKEWKLATIPTELRVVLLLVRPVVETGGIAQRERFVEEIAAVSAVHEKDRKIHCDICRIVHFFSSSTCKKHRQR